MIVAVRTECLAKKVIFMILWVEQHPELGLGALVVVKALYLELIVCLGKLHEKQSLERTL